MNEAEYRRAIARERRIGMEYVEKITRDFAKWAGAPTQTQYRWMVLRQQMERAMRLYAEHVTKVYNEMARAAAVVGVFRANPRHR